MMYVSPFRARPARFLAVLSLLLLVSLRLSRLRDLSLRETIVVGYRKTHVFTTSDSPAIKAPIANMAPAQPHFRIAKVTIATNKLETDIIRRALQTHERHNARHGYTQFTATRQAVGSLTENDRHKRPKGAWTKPAYLLSILVAELQKPGDERLEWVFWFDADTVILNPSTPLDIFLPPPHLAALRSVDLLITANWDGLNSGVFALRVSPWSVSFLSAVLAYPIYEADRTRRDRFRDQAAFQFLLGQPDSPLVRHAPGGMGGHERWVTVPMRWFNSLPVNNAFRKDGTWVFGGAMSDELFDRGTDEVYDDGHGGRVKPWKVMRGDLAVHFAGTGADRVRESWMGPWVERAEAMAPEWDNATATEVLREEVREFWERQNGRMRIDKDKADRKERQREAEREEKKRQKEKQEAADREAERERKEKEAEMRREEERQKEEEKAAKQMADKLKVFEEEEDSKKSDEDRIEEAAKQEEAARVEAANLEAANFFETLRLQEEALKEAEKQKEGEEQKEPEKQEAEPEEHAELGIPE